MEFSKRFLVVLLAAFCLFHLAAANLNREKRKAIRDINNQMHDIQILYRKTLADVEKSKRMTGYIRNFWWDFGMETKHDMDYKLNKTAKTAFIKAKESKESKKVVKCILKIKKDAANKNNKFFDGFYTSMFHQQYRFAIKTEEEKIKYWKYSCDDFMQRYKGFYEKARKEIREANDKETISKSVKNLKISTDSYLRSIPDVLKDMAKIQNRLLGDSQVYIHSLKHVGIRNRKTAAQDMQKCFSS